MIYGIFNIFLQKKSKEHILSNLAEATKRGPHQSFKPIPFSLKVMLRRFQEKSRLYHTKLIEERVADSIRAAANLQEQVQDFNCQGEANHHARNIRKISCGFEYCCR